MNAPVPLLYERGALAESEVEEILLLKRLQSVAVRSPRALRDAEGILNENVPPELVTLKSEPVVEVAIVIAPVCAEPKECWSEDTPFCMDEVATQVGTPFTSASTWPFVPAEVVAKAPEPLPRRMLFA